MLTALYIHVPFCNQICTYCDFVKEVATFAKKKRYINALKKEFIDNKHLLHNIETIYIGGGTPSALENELLIELLSTIKDNVSFESLKEYSIETNPNDIDDVFSKTISKYGINRVSVGVQTFDNEQLMFLNRSHKKEDIKKAINTLRNNDIENISIDMIFSLIKQTEEELRNDISKISKLNINHISYYSLILEEKTRLYYLYKKGEISMNDEDLEAKMYNIVLDELEKIGFNHYEISNFEKNGNPSLHNMIYWQNKDYLGLGAGAHGLIDSKRYHNPSSVKRYIEGIESGDNIKTFYERDAITEELMMGLRLLKGINVEEVNNKYNIDIFTKYDKLHYFITEGLLQLGKGYLSFTRKGLFLGNIIFAHFLEG